MTEVDLEAMNQKAMPYLSKIFDTKFYFINFFNAVFILL